MIQDYKNLFSLEGKHALVTGGAQGLGLTIARGLLRRRCYCHRSRYQ